VRAVFLDRDGVINPDPGWISAPEQLELYSHTAESIRRLNRAGFLVVVITNQSVVARGKCSREAVEEIHQHLQQLLAEHGAHLDAFYVCPHHPDFDDEPCSCRKPSPELILRAMDDFGIEAAESVMVGDKASDMEAGRHAGLYTILVTAEPSIPPEHADQSVSADLMVLDLAEAVTHILGVSQPWGR